MDERNFTYMFYGFVVAWLIPMIYVISLARRSSRLRKETDELKQLFEEKQASARPKV
jgi:CcmD family protein